MGAKKIALVFPGQGSQKVGMGKTVFEALPVAAEVWNTADRFLGYPLSKLCFEGPEEELKQTRNAQVALFASEVAILRALEEKAVSHTFSAGHSVGEYAALVAAGALDFEEGLKLVVARARAMDKAATDKPGAMAAVLGLDVERVRACVDSACSAGIVGIANFNAPEQIVISGEVSAVEAASKAACDAGAKRVVPLAVSGAFHSPLMQAAADDLSIALSDAVISDPEKKVVLNVTADFAKDSSEIREMLGRQVVSQVRWHESMQVLIADGCDGVVECGPGKVLSGLARRMEGAPELVLNIEEAADLDAAVYALS